ncbi:CIC11C00000002847 [Sungouiella intermedia]|uniref:BRO domain-containing protein 1 n=1 Tax=Sungouiella intermedia TaxID=45354 RepID=A0A1L0C3V4_9ASCO|nr:CIC11C00000002847 [[Candida] intermedia]
MKTALLVVPTKKTEDTNWIKPLNNYLLSIYGNTSDYQKDLADFNKLRQDIRGVSADKTGIKLYLTYFSQLELLDLRVPVATINKHKKLIFNWYDAFLPGSLHIQHALPFEKASVLFNLGSLMSKVASVKYNESQRTSSGEDGAFKEAIQYLQQAAGVFEFLSENFLHAPSSDLQPATVKFLINLCLSQSQEIFTLKVIDGDLEQKKNSLISKLCKGTANHYAECFSVCAHLLTAEGIASLSDQSTFSIVEAGLDDDELALGSGDDDEGNLDEYNPDKQGMPDSNVTARLYPVWIATIQFKQMYYESLAYYFQGLQLEATSKFGDAIAYLTKSHDLINEIPSSILKVISKAGGEEAYDLLDNYKYQKDALGIKLKDLTKDNDLIYNEIIPSIVTIPEPKPMDSAKVLPMNKIDLFAEVNEYNYHNFLKNVVPIDIHELLSYYSEEKSQLLRNELDELDVSNKELSTLLEHLKLPKALINIKEIINHNKELETDGHNDENSISPEVLAEADEIASRFSIDVENRKVIAEIRQRIFQSVTESESLMAGQYSVSAGRYREDLIKLKKSLYDAANSDSRLFALIDSENSELYHILGKGPSSPQFKSLFKVKEVGTEKQSKPVEEISLLDIDDSQLKPREGSIDDQITELEDILLKLNKNKNEKAKLVAELKNEIHSDDISDILMLNSKVKSTNEIRTVIFPKELEKFEAYGHGLDKLIAQQLDLSGELNAKWNNLVSNPKVKDVQKSKTFHDELYKQQTERINRFYNENWKKYTNGLSKGTEFYTQLLKFSENLKRTIQNEMQRGSITESMSGLSLQENSTGGSRQYNSGSFFQPNQNYGFQEQNSGQHGQSTGQYGQNSGQYGQTPGQYAQTTGQYGQGTGQYGQDPGHFAQYPQRSQPHQPEVQLQYAVLNQQQFSRAPALPPKAPSQSFDNHPNPANHTPNQGQYALPSRQNTSSSVNSQGNTSNSQNPTGLIYDQPSTYQPNMYNFFLGQG